MPDFPPAPVLDPHFRKILREEVLRWNRQFSLISRVDPEARVEALLDESQAALPAFLSGFARFDPSGRDFLAGAEAVDLRYVDIGSGGGFPGLPWFGMLQALVSGAGAGRALSGALVEPRRKRAWFLERCRDRLGLKGLEVVECRWGQRRIADSVAFSASDAPRRIWILTMQALRLDDDDILAGWRRMTGRDCLLAGESLVICRFHAESEPLDESLRSRLHLPPRLDDDAPGAPRSLLLPLAGGPEGRTLLISHYPSGG